MAEPVKILEVVDETSEAKSLVLELPAGWSYRPGQFLTLRLDGIARCYSLSSSPFTGERPKITVKRMPEGVGSNWVCDNLTAGSVVEMLPPNGLFTPESLDRDLLLFAGGSGITPVMSILKSALCQGNGRIVLVYANRDESSIIFREELARLCAEHADRLAVHHWLDAEKGWPTAEGIRALTEPVQHYERFVCGPDQFLDVVKSAMGDDVHVEQFMSLVDNPFELAAATTDKVAKLEVAIDNQVYHFDWPVQTKLLDLLMSKGINAPFSCRQANCGTCACRVVKGEVKMLANEILEEEDFAENYVLACQALPLTDEVSVTYE